MDESDFHDRVAQSGEIDDPDPIAKATAPGSLRSPVAVSVARGATLSRPSARLSRAVFVERVRDRAAGYAGGGVPDETDELEPRVEAVTEALQGVIPREEQRGLRSQLSDDVESLFTDGEGGR